jgi:hypothetical protein
MIILKIATITMLTMALVASIIGIFSAVAVML